MGIAMNARLERNARMSKLSEAIKEINKHFPSSSCGGYDELIKALQTAIEVLQAADADGCDECKYLSKDIYEMPCVNCKRGHKDLWTPRKD